MKFQIGDLVQLKSGGPVMTVSGFGESNGHVYCEWFTQDHVKSHTDSFKPETLKSVE